MEIFFRAAALTIFAIYMSITDAKEVSTAANVSIYFLSL
jgi:hypothetical protein